ncbi:MAG TPA: AMP-binding protein [Albitalea sp.]|uniref:AMP-binding protein n=1 Tax=Piscinibacter sp. TaxID=1903157 RepID=UPI002ED48A59
MLLDRFLHDSAQRHPHKLALICGEHRATYAEVDGGANALAHAFKALGLQRQERVAVYLDNSVEAVQALFAAMKAAGVFVVVNPQTKGDKLAFILKDCNVRILVTSARALHAVAGELQGCPDLRDVVLVDAPTGPELDALAAGGVRLHVLDELLAAHPRSLPDNPGISLDLASLVYTSGSTGLPKGVTLTHLNMVTAAASITTYLRNEPDDIVLSPLPLAFDYGLYQVLMAFRFGGTVVLEKQFVYPYKYIELIEKERVTGLPIVPTISAILLNLKDLEEHDFSSVRYLTNTAQALPEHHIRRLRQVMPRARLYSMYGLTECKRVAYLPPELVDRKPTSVGVAIPGTEVWIEDEAGQVVTTPGQAGELIVRGAHVMVGYWNRPEETARALRPGRYPYERELRTGDLFRQDADGHLYFISRKDDLIKTAGERVGPREVENVLYEIEAVKEAAVIGVPDDTLGSAIKAFVALRDGLSLTEAEVIKHCQKRLEKFMVPKHVAFVPELPKTSTGKISKRGLA